MRTQPAWTRRRPLCTLLTSALLLAPLAAANPNPHPSEQAGFTYNELFARYDCGGTTCGYYGQVCCTPGTGCFTNAANEATCTPNAAAAPTASASGGYWQYYTTTYVQTDLQTITSTISSYVATASAVCNYALSETPCGGICCASNQYCFTQNQCAPADGGGSSGYYSSYTPPVTATGAGATTTPGAPLRGTTSGVVTATETASPFTTVPFIPPVATGANITLTGSMTSNSGLSGGAIAGIVIGVLVGLLILGIILICCCCVSILDGLLALFGLGVKKQRRTEIDEYERYSHHSSGGPKRTWYGAPVRRQSSQKKDNEGRNILAILGGLGALWVLLGLKRKHDQRERKEEAQYSEYSYSEDYYTSASSESSDRRTCDTRRDRSRSQRRSASRR